DVPRDARVLGMPIGGGGGIPRLPSRAGDEERDGEGGEKGLHRERCSGFAQAQSFHVFQVRQVTLAKQTSAVTKQIAGPSFGLFTSFGMKDATAVTLQKPRAVPRKTMEVAVAAWTNPFIPIAPPI